MISFSLGIAFAQNKYRCDLVNFYTVNKTEYCTEIVHNTGHILEECRSRRWHMFFKIGVLKNFAVFAGKRLFWSLFLIKLIKF